MSTIEPWRNPRPAPNLDEVRQRIPPSAFLTAWLRAWWPALAWATMIFVMSTDSFSANQTSHFFAPLLRWIYPALAADQFDFIHHFIRKMAHFIEYFIFFLLLYRGVRGPRPGWHWSWALVAWLIAAGYSALDEIHQIFVPSRGPSPLDSLLDSTGALIALLVLFFLYRRILRPRSA